jgi:hypothetical protein
MPQLSQPYLWVWVREVCDALLVWLHLVTLAAVE